jgi:hypothetical protein
MLWLKEAVGEREEMFAWAGGEPKSAILLKGVRRLFPTLPPQQPTPQARIAARCCGTVVCAVCSVYGNTSTTHRGTLCTAAKARLGRVWSGPLTTAAKVLLCDVATELKKPSCPTAPH